MSKVLISVIVPVYNTEKYVTECIKSILAQDYENFELILVDNNSSDNSYKICEKFVKQDKRIRLAQTKKPGAGMARNKGIEEARGDFIAFVDSDDIVSANYLSVLVSGIADNADLSCVKYTNFSDKAIFKNSSSDSKLISNTEATRQLLLGKLLAGPVCKLYKRKLIGDLRFEPYSVAEDFLFNYNYLKQCEQISLNSSALYGYRRNENSLTKSAFKESRMDGLTVMEQIAKEENYSEESIIRLFMEAYFILESLDHYKQLKDYPSQVSECKKIIKQYRKRVLFAKSSPKRQRSIALMSAFNPLLPAKIINLLKK